MPFDEQRGDQGFDEERRRRRRRFRPRIFFPFFGPVIVPGFGFPRRIRRRGFFFR